ncbi:PilW family protein [Pelotalea chapellei]|uniref:Prepilin-type N-terminal cleavage/methylation domain-containing protein n=1 Tax=Pelotalea chapellei TaxID=44671 RepID=A0ABS5U471_9BACT|nr:PilW family protein [Pelotalea chapellei]MBT1070454.1 prepilin-type N-terminal cleavage/methylation domain-containing protein [Pelotalea chapellei]
MNINHKGFTLVELLMTMTVFIIAIIIAGNSFNAILSHTSKLFRSEESNIEGVVGLEILRHDLQQAGYGLYTEPMGIDYSEAAAAPANAYNDAATNVPRPLVAGNNLAAVTDTSDTGPLFDILPSTDYLAIKATTVARNRTAQKWTYLRYTSNDVYPNRWVSNAENFATNDKVMLLRRQISTAGQAISVVPGTLPNAFYYPFSNTAFSHLVSLSADVYTVYGLDDGAGAPRMPFNRSDYFVARPQDATTIPAFCAPNTGILYKTTVNQSGGKLNYVPIMDCVADMQVVLGWDMNGDGMLDTYSNADGSAVTGTGSSTDVQTAMANAANNTSTITPNIRNSLKIIKVYILAQQGRRDPGYTSPSTIQIGDNAESSLTRPATAGMYDIAAAGWQNYRWKVYRVIAHPKNLPANQ